MSLLHVSRPCLNITCSSKGLVGGRLVVDNRRTGGTVPVAPLRCWPGSDAYKAWPRPHHWWLPRHVCWPCPVATGVETDCSLQPNGVEVTGDIAAIRRLAFQSAALLILVVEKDTVFQVWMCAGLGACGTCSEVG